ncbi:beta-ketoacyl reductase [Aspergillus homomorphus CBS 101889]|uniref:Uncharacterized protein n=1 Tax=Aspergillus homomorphus (strain CBS 101889) TaxID=1450537 RepID=A0A395HR04_ASPHC|nr:hypothetical protein BO97DRAFT_426771 [Aspergillus homomorphus CBS 101889]RAL10247.1 hypothetical protein BO97DRAFT_426771 [Aspergillus homomorphus CBS 101889]
MTCEDYHFGLDVNGHGTINLSKQFGGDSELDFFIQLSGIYGLLGTDMLASYAARNAFQDPRQFLYTQGYEGIGLSELLNLLEQIIRHPHRTPVASLFILGSRDTQIDVNDHLCSIFHHPKFSHIITAKVKPDGAEVQRTPTLSTEEARTAVPKVQDRKEASRVFRELFERKLVKLLGLSQENVQRCRSLSDLGTDTLAAVELRNWIGVHLCSSAQTMEILSPMPIDEFVEMVAKRSSLTPVGLFE